MVIVMFATTTPVVTADRQLADYLQLVNAPDFNPADLPLETAWLRYPLLRPLFSRVFCTPATLHRSKGSFRKMAGSCALIEHA